MRLGYLVQPHTSYRPRTSGTNETIEYAFLHFSLFLPNKHEREKNMSMKVKIKMSVHSLRVLFQAETLEAQKRAHDWATTFD
jgi:hypothetical protein